MKNKIIIISIAALSVIGGGTLLIYLANSSDKKIEMVTGSLIGGKEYSIELTDKGFIPAEITIMSGDTIRFSASPAFEFFWPASNLHPTHGIYPEFDPQEPIESGKTWTFRFEKTGTWSYHDHLYPYFKGKITVSNLPG